MVINEIKQQKYNLLFLGLFAVIAILIFQQSQMIADTNRSETTSAKDIRHTFNQSLNNFDGIVLDVNLSQQNHLDHKKELSNQKIIMNQSVLENKLLTSINASLSKIANMDKNMTSDDNNLVKEDNATLSRGLHH